MPRAAPPGQRIEVEKQRNWHGFYVRPELGLPLEQDQVVAFTVVLNVVVGMRRQRRTVRVECIVIARPAAIRVGRSCDKARRKPAPLSSGQIEGVHIRSEVVIVSTTKDDHSTSVPHT